ncbi:AraC family transcriptional regulator [Oscillospiraceae bacterium HV4-5-C5C]|nr:AraC family transcriptional regulator [Oscillospiraceae bacterium HV4-5-C5C]
MTRRQEIYEKLSLNWSPDSIRLFVSQTPISRSLPFFVQEAGDFKTFYPYYTERRNLPSLQFIYTLRGQGCLDLGDRHFEVRPESVLLINCFRPHRYYTAPGQTWDFLWVHFWGPAAAGFAALLEQYQTGPFATDHPWQIELWLRRLLSLNQRRCSGYEVQSSAVIDSLLSDLLLQQLFELKPAATADRALSQALSYIQAHAAEDLSLQQLARIAGLSKYYFARQFKALTGQTVQEYIIRTRLERAKAKLRDTSLSLNDIAFSCGIHSATHLINLFKTREGLTPHQYRRQWQTTGGPRPRL